MAGCGTPYTDAQQTTPTYQTAYVWSDTVTVTLTATGSGENVLIAWAADCAGADTCTLSAGADKTVVAIFGAPGSGHPNFMDPAIHGPAYLASVRNANALRCATCHGSNLDGQSIAPSCNDCHLKAGHPDWQNDCNFCHGAPPPKYVSATPTPPHTTVSSDVTKCYRVPPHHGERERGHHRRRDAPGRTDSFQGGGHAAGFANPSVHGPQYLDYVGSVPGARTARVATGRR